MAEAVKPRGITLAPLFRMKAEVDGPMHLAGRTPLGYTRRIVMVTGGWFEGERLKGRILSGGGDYVAERPDGGLHLDVRLVLQTDADEIVYLTYTGRRNGPPEVMRKIVAREPIPVGADYFRVAMQFETGAPRLAWLNDIIAIGTGTREANGPLYDVWEVA